MVKLNVLWITLNMIHSKESMGDGNSKRRATKYIYLFVAINANTCLSEK